MSRLLGDWPTWLPRLMFAAVALLTAQYGLGILTRSKVVDSLQGAIGARAELAHARVSARGPQLVLSDVRVADPREPLQNLVEATQCDFDLAAEPLLHKRIVVENGTISGLRFGTPRTESGSLEGERPVAGARQIQWWNDETNHETEEWLDHLDQRFDPELIDQFESIKRTAGLVERIERETTALEERVLELTRRAEELQAKVNRAMANPLRHGEFLKTVAEEIPALEQEFAHATEAMQRLPQTIDADRRTIVAARQHDHEWIRQQLQLPPIDAASLTSYLLEKQTTAPLNDVVGWLHLIRQLVPAHPQSAPPSGRRGEDIFFAGCDPLPRFLVRELALSGEAVVGGRPLEFRGTLSDYAATPELHTKPMRIRIASAGPSPLVLQATIDRTKSLAHDELFVDCREIVLPPLELGESDRLRLALAPSVGTLSISLKLAGEELSGDIQLVQKQVRITPTVGGDLSDVPLAESLDETLSNVGALATRVSLGGTLEEPKCRVWSSLGAAAAEALDRALTRAAEQHARRMLAESQRKVDEQLTELERQVAEAQAEIQPQLARAAGQLVNVAAQQKRPKRITTQQAGRQLPANSLLR